MYCYLHFNGQLEISVKLQYHLQCIKKWDIKDKYSLGYWYMQQHGWILMVLW